MNWKMVSHRCTSDPGLHDQDLQQKRGQDIGLMEGCLAPKPTGGHFMRFSTNISKPRRLTACLWPESSTQSEGGISTETPDTSTSKARDPPLVSKLSFQLLFFLWQFDMQDTSKLDSYGIYSPTNTGIAATFLGLIFSWSICKCLALLKQYSQDKPHCQITVDIFDPNWGRNINQKNTGFSMLNLKWVCSVWWCTHVGLDRLATHVKGQPSPN